MTTGEKIKEARKKAGMTQAELGALLGVSGSMIGQWENDFRHPKLETRAKIADALGIKDFELASIHKPNKNHRRELEKMMGKEEGYLDKMSARRDWPINQQRLVNAFDLLNDAGQQKAVERVEELTEIHKYQRQPPQEPSAAPSEGTDTANTENAATGPQETK